MLRTSEWLLTCSLLLILISLFAIAKIQSSRFDGVPEMKTELVSVSVLGHVEKPGVYNVEVGALLSDVVKKSKPRRDADLRGIAGRVEISQSVNVVELGSLKISLEGAVVVPGFLEVPLGSRVCDLKNLVALKDDVDKAFFKKRRLLRDGEVIKIPSKDRQKT